MASFKDYRPEQIHQLVFEFENIARETQQSPSPWRINRFHARGSNLFRVWLKLKERLENGVAYVDTNPEDHTAALLYHQLIEAETRVKQVLGAYWREDFRLTMAKIIFDAEEIDDRDINKPSNDSTGTTPAGSDNPGGVPETDSSDAGREVGPSNTETEPEGRGEWRPDYRFYRAEVPDGPGVEFGRSGEGDGPESGLPREDRAG